MVGGWVIDPFFYQPSQVRSFASSSRINAASKGKLVKGAKKEVDTEAMTIQDAAAILRVRQALPYAPCYHAHIRKRARPLRLLHPRLHMKLPSLPSSREAKQYLEAKYHFQRMRGPKRRRSSSLPLASRWLPRKMLALIMLVERNSSHKCVYS